MAGILFVVPQDLILAPLLFNIFLFIFTLNNTEISNHADETTSYAVYVNIDDLISFFEKS